MHDNEEYIIHKINLKPASNHRLVLKTVYRISNFHQEAWLKPYIDINIDLRKKEKKYFEKDFPS